MRSLSIRNNGIKGTSSQITTGHDLISDWEAHERQHMRSAMAAIGDFPIPRHSSSHHRVGSTEGAGHHSLSGLPSSSVFQLHKSILPAASSTTSVTANPTASSEGNHSVMSQDMSYTNFASEQLSASKPQIRLQVGRMPTIISQSPSHPDETQRELSPHPYAYGAILPSSSAPLPASPDIPPLSRARPRSGFFNGIKSSISTPNLRHNPFLPKAKEKWFAAQTWCDAFFFPRPRFRVHTSNAGEHLDKGMLPMRMMSPAESSPDPGKEAAKERSFYLESQHQNKPYKSQSTADLLQSSSRPDNQVRPKDHLTLRATLLSPTHTPGDRPRSFALDDLALPSPAPSLARVLAEGEQLQLDRQAWQRQASHSFQNKRSRSLSRLRAKSLSRQSQSQFNTDRHPPMELLAARTLLGQQLDIPHIRLRKPPSSMAPTQLPNTDIPNLPFLSTSNTQSLSNLFSKKHSSYTHSNSQSTQAPRIRPRATSAAAAQHSRTMSWSRKIAGRRGTTATDSSLRIIPPSWPNSNGGSLSPDMSSNVNVLTLDSVRLTTSSSPKDQHQPITSASPTPSNSSGFGIAVSSPPFPENGLDKESEQIHIRAHPYAQCYDYYSHPSSQPQKLGANINASEMGTSHQRGPSHSSDFAGPHPSIPPVVSIPALASSDCPVNDIVMRHRLPPQALLRPNTYRHPYSNRVALPRDTSSDDGDDMILHPLAHPNSSIPPPAKMYAELLTLGDVHEVLPEDIRYSPYVPTPTKHSMPASSLNHGVSTASQKQAELSTATIESNHAYSLSGHDSRRDTRLGMDDVLEYALRRNECSSQEALGWAPLSIPSKARNDNISSPQLTDKSNPEFTEHIYVSQTGAYNPNVAPYMDSEVFASHPKPPQALSSSSSDVPHTSFKRLRSELSDNSGSTSHSGSIPQFLLHPLDGNNGLDRFDDLFVQPEDGYPGHSTTDSERKDFTHRVTSIHEMPNTLCVSESSAEDGITQEHDEIHASSLEGDHDVEGYPVTLSISHLDDRFSREVLYRDHSRAVKFSNTSKKHDHDDRSFTGSESSVVSSTLEFSPTDETFGIRMGFIDTSLTPPIITSTQYRRTSSHAFPEDADEDPDDTGPSVSLSTNLSPHLSLPRSVSDGTRASFMTSGTDTSRISNLSDFPAPPSVTPAHMSVLQSYFDESPTGETGRYPSSKR